MTDPVLVDQDADAPALALRGRPSHDGDLGTGEARVDARRRGRWKKPARRTRTIKRRPGIRGGRVVGPQRAAGPRQRPVHPWEPARTAASRRRAAAASARGGRGRQGRSAAPSHDGQAHGQVALDLRSQLDPLELAASKASSRRVAAPEAVRPSASRARRRGSEQDRTERRGISSGSAILPVGWRREEPGCRAQAGAVLSAGQWTTGRQPPRTASEGHLAGLALGPSTAANERAAGASVRTGRRRAGGIGRLARRRTEARARLAPRRGRAPASGSLRPSVSRRGLGQTRRGGGRPRQGLLAPDVLDHRGLGGGEREGVVVDQADLAVGEEVEMVSTATPREQKVMRVSAGSSGAPAAAGAAVLNLTSRRTCPGRGPSTVKPCGSFNSGRPAGPATLSQPAAPADVHDGPAVIGVGGDVLQTRRAQVASEPRPLTRTSAGCAGRPGGRRNAAARVGALDEERVIELGARVKGRRRASASSALDRGGGPPRPRRSAPTGAGTARRVRLGGGSRALRAEIAGLRNSASSLRARWAGER